MSEEHESGPLVSVVTPTFPGRERELGRCMERVLDLDWPWVQHVVVSDRTEHQEAIEREWHEAVEARIWRPMRTGNDADALPPAWDHRLTFVQINESWRNKTTEASIGAIPWYVGSLLALGEFIAFCGDDDELLPDHVKRHVAAMIEERAMFSISAVQFRAHGTDAMMIGPGFEHGQLDATGIMCHRDALAVASWSADGTNAADYRLVRDWLSAGLVGTLIPGAPTGIHNDGWLIGKTGRPDRPK